MVYIMKTKYTAQEWYAQGLIMQWYTKRRRAVRNVNINHTLPPSPHRCWWNLLEEPDPNINQLFRLLNQNFILLTCTKEFFDNIWLNCKIIKHKLSAKFVARFGFSLYIWNCIKYTIHTNISHIKIYINNFDSRR